MKKRRQSDEVARITWQNGQKWDVINDAENGLQKPLKRLINKVLYVRII